MKNEREERISKPRLARRAIALAVALSIAFSPTVPLQAGIATEDESQALVPVTGALTTMETAPTVVERATETASGFDAANSLISASLQAVTVTKLDRRELTAEETQEVKNILGPDVDPVSKELDWSGALTTGNVTYGPRTIIYGRDGKPVGSNVETSVHLINGPPETTTKTWYDAEGNPVAPNSTQSSNTAAGEEPAQDPAPNVIMNQPEPAEPTRDAGATLGVQFEVTGARAPGTSPLTVNERWEPVDPVCREGDTCFAVTNTGADSREQDAQPDPGGQAAGNPQTPARGIAVLTRDDANGEYILIEYYSDGSVGTTRLGSFIPSDATIVSARAEGTTYVITFIDNGTQRTITIEEGHPALPVEVRVTPNPGPGPGPDPAPNPDPQPDPAPNPPPSDPPPSDPPPSDPPAPPSDPPAPPSDPPAPPSDPPAPPSDPPAPPSDPPAPPDEQPAPPQPPIPPQPPEPPPAGPMPGMDVRVDNARLFNARWEQGGPGQGMEPGSSADSAKVDGEITGENLEMLGMMLQPGGMWEGILVIKDITDEPDPEKAPEVGYWVESIDVQENKISFTLSIGADPDKKHKYWYKFTFPGFGPMPAATPEDPGGSSVNAVPGDPPAPQEFTGTFTLDAQPREKTKTLSIREIEANVLHGEQVQVSFSPYDRRDKVEITMQVKIGDGKWSEESVVATNADIKCAEPTSSGFVWCRAQFPAPGRSETETVSYTVRVYINDEFDKEATFTKDHVPVTTGGTLSGFTEFGIGGDSGKLVFITVKAEGRVDYSVHVWRELVAAWDKDGNPIPLSEDEKEEHKKDIHSGQLKHLDWQDPTNPQQGRYNQEFSFWKKELFGTFKDRDTGEAKQAYKVTYNFWIEINGDPERFSEKEKTFERPKPVTPQTDGEVTKTEEDDGKKITFHFKATKDYPAGTDYESVKGVKADHVIIVTYEDGTTKEVERQTRGVYEKKPKWEEWERSFTKDFMSVYKQWGGPEVQSITAELYVYIEGEDPSTGFKGRQTHEWPQPPPPPPKEKTPAEVVHKKIDVSGEERPDFTFHVRAVHRDPPLAKPLRAWVTYEVKDNFGNLMPSPRGELHPITIYKPNDVDAEGNPKEDVWKGNPDLPADVKQPPDDPTKWKYAATVIATMQLEEYDEKSGTWKRRDGPVSQQWTRKTPDWERSENQLVITTLEASAGVWFFNRGYKIKARVDCPPESTNGCANDSAIVKYYVVATYKHRWRLSEGDGQPATGSIATRTFTNSDKDLRTGGASIPVGEEKIFKDNVPKRITENGYSYYLVSIDVKAVVETKMGERKFANAHAGSGTLPEDFQEATSLPNSNSSSFVPSPPDGNQRSFRGDRLMQFVSNDRPRTTLNFSYNYAGRPVGFTKTHANPESRSAMTTSFDTDNGMATEQYADGSQKIYGIRLDEGSPETVEHLDERETVLASWSMPDGSGGYLPPYAMIGLLFESRPGEGDPGAVVPEGNQGGKPPLPPEPPVILPREPLGGAIPRYGSGPLQPPTNGGPKIGNPPSPPGVPHGGDRQPPYTGGPPSIGIGSRGSPPGRSGSPYHGGPNIGVGPRGGSPPPGRSIYHASTGSHSPAHVRLLARQDRPRRPLRSRQASIMNMVLPAMVSSPSEE